MPNVAPREVPIYDPAGVKREAQAFYVEDVGALHRPVHRMWVWDGNTGAWQVAWADAAAPPASVTASYVASGSSVLLTWTNSTPRVADRWQVERPDGSVLGVVDYTTLTLSDPDPKPLNGAYTVRGLLGPLSGPATSSNTLDLRLMPVSFTATWNESLGQVDFGGTGPALGAPDSWHYYRGDDGTYVGGNTGAGPNGSDAAPHLGGLYTYSIRAVLGTTEGPAVTSAAVAVPPGAPRVQSWGPVGANNLRVVFWGPASGTWTNFQIETSPDGSTWTVRSTNNTDGIYDFATSSPAYVRVRTNAPGGTRYGATVGPATPITDVTPPAAPTFTSFQPESSYGHMILRGTYPSDADLNYARVYRTYTGGPGWEIIAEGAVSPGAAFVFDCGTIGSGTMTIQMDVRDSNGNWRSPGATIAYTLTASPTTVTPVQTNYWASSFNQYNLSGDRRPREGYLSDPTLWHIGFWYYGTAIAAACAGKTVYQMTVVLVRIPGGVATAGMTTVCLHNYTTDPGSASSAQPVTFGLQDVGSQAAPSTIQPALSADFVNRLAAGTQRGVGVFRYPTMKPYQVYANLSDNPLTGVISIFHLG